MEITALILALIFTVIITSFYSNYKRNINQNYQELINNIYFQKTITNALNNLEPKFKKINHKVNSGEKFDQILLKYSVDRNDINEIKKILSNKININNLPKSKIITLTIDQTKNKVVSFTYPLSQTEKINISREGSSKDYNQEIIVTKLTKKILYKENEILQSLYRAATKVKTPPNIIIEFARIYGFQVDFQRDIKKKDSFQIMYEVFVDNKGKIIQTGEILFANLNLSGIENSLYYFNKKEVKVIMIVAGKV